MAAHIYSAPKEIIKPVFDWKDMKKSNADEKRYIDEIKAFCKNYSKCNIAGEIIQFQVADGYAQYMVLTLKPLALIHIDTGDSWHFQYVKNLTVADVKKEVQQNKARAEMFTKWQIEKEKNKVV